MFDETLDPITRGGGEVNVYNYREFGNYDFSDMVNFLNQNDTKTRYHVPSMIQFSDVNITVYQQMVNDFMTSKASYIVDILNENIPVMIYNGQDDIICNTPST